MTRGVAFILVLLNVLLAALLAWLWISPTGAVRGIRWQPPAAIRPDLGALSGAVAQRDDADTSRFMAIIDRPVFSASRRPPPPPPPPKVVVPVPPDPLNTIHLYGLFGGDGSGGVIARVDGKTRRIKISEPVGQWTLKEIKPGAVVFAKGAETRVVPIVQAKQSPGAAVAAPAFGTPRAPAAEPAAATEPETAPAVPGPGQPPAAPPRPRGPQQPAGAAGTPSSPFVIGGSR